MNEYAYQLDTTGVSPENLISEEEQVLTESNYKDYAYIIPDFAPFYITNLTVVHVQQDDSERELVMGVDYYPALQFVAATRSIGRELWGGISFTNRNIQGIVKLTYQTLGGKWVGDRQYVLESLAERNYNPRIAYWDDVTNVQEIFPVINHEQEYDTIYGQAEVINAIDRLAGVVSNGGFGVEYSRHLTNFDNPHGVTLKQLGYDAATEEDMELGSGPNKFISVDLYRLYNQRNLDAISDLDTRLNALSIKVEDLDTRLKILSGDLVSEITRLDTKFTDELAVLKDGILDRIREHMADTSNPHQVTKEQVGLGLVVNYPMAEDMDVEENLALDKYVTLRQIVDLINVVESHTLVDYPSTVMLGEEFTVKLVTQRVTSGTFYRWSLDHGTTDESMFDTKSGEIVILNNEATFKVKIVDRIHLKGQYQFAIQVFDSIDTERLLAKTTTITIDNRGIDDVEYLTPFSFYDVNFDNEYGIMTELFIYNAENTNRSRFIETVNNDYRKLLSKPPAMIMDDAYSMRLNYVKPDKQDEVDMAEALFFGMEGLADTRTIVGNISLYE